jgi:hypothetical protein
MFSGLKELPGAIVALIVLALLVAYVIGFFVARVTPDWIGLAVGAVIILILGFLGWNWIVEKREIA